MHDERSGKPTIPITWKGAGTAIEDRAIVVADNKQIASFGDQRVRTCGSCRHFRGTDKDRPEISGFVARTIYEAKWKLGFLTHRPEELGRCGENAELAVGVNSRACDHYTEARGRLR
jgi:hypothetical protein